MSFPRILKLFLVWQVAVLLVISLSGRLFPRRDLHLGGLEKRSALDPDPVGRNPFVYARGNFDGIHYIDIARKDSRGVGQTAFFPLYPELIRIFTPIFRDSTVAALIISSAGFLVGLYFFARLVRVDYGSRIALWSVVSLLVFPVSFFFGSVYTEGLFFSFLMAAFYFARRQRWWVAVILAALAGYTRLIGIFLLPAFLIELLIQSQEQKSSRRYFFTRLPLLLVIPLGLILYMLYLQQTTGDPLAFYHTQALFQQGRGEKLVLLYQVFWRYLKMLFTVNRADPLYLTILLEFSVAVYLTAVSVYNFIRQRLSYAIFGFLAFILPTLTGTFTSLPRYALLCFPVFIFSGGLLARSSRRYQFFFMAVSGLLFIIYTSLFIRGYWVS